MVTDRNSLVHNERGASLVEMALVSVLLVTLLAGVADLGRAFYTYVAITNAAREGARYGSRMPCYNHNRDTLRSNIVEAVNNEADSFAIDMTSAIVTITPDPVEEACAGWTAGAELRVQVSLDIDTILAGILRAGTIALRSDARMVLFGND